jgi:CRISPR-associated protein Cmr5
MLTRNQEYASKIFRQVSTITEDAEKKKYGSMAHKLPVLIRTAGLAQALEFVHTRPDEPQRRILDHLAKVVGCGTSDELLNKSRNDELSDYIQLTQKVMAALLWYKRFAQSVLKVEPGQDADTK